jgi:hypothetical protein
MALLLERRVAPSLTKLFGHAIEHGVYRRKTRAEIEHNGPGWKGALLNEVPVFFNEYGFEATLVQELSSKDVIRALAEEYYVLPRVGPDIRFPGRKRPSKKTGHFVFLYAYTTSPSGKVIFRINNSAGFHSLNSQVAFPVPEARFTQVFSGDAILVRAHHPLP